LTAESDSVTWDVDEDYARGQKLVIKQILLGAEAKENEFNVVEVSTPFIVYAERGIQCM